MIVDDEASRDLAGLVVPQAGRLRATGDRYEPYRLVDADGVAVAAATEGLVDKLLEAVDIRNYLAHHFLREFFMAVPSQENLHDASSQLADLSVWLKELESELDAHLVSLGIEAASSLDAEAIAVADSLRPEKWFGFVAHEEAN